MKAIVISRYGDPDVLTLRDVREPEAARGSIVVRVRAFGLNHAEVYFRRGSWGDVAKISGIECVGEVHDPGSSALRRGQRVLALMGGMGRSIDGSYAELVRVPEGNVVPIESALPWERLATIPESYATAWTFIDHMLDVRAGQQLVIRGGTSALGQAAIEVALRRNARVIATTRSPARMSIIEALGAEPMLEAPSLGLRDVDAVLDIIGTATLVDSLKLARYRGRVAMAGFLGGNEPLAFDPMRDLPSGVQLSFFASAFAFGQPALPLSAIPFAEFTSYRATPAHVFAFDEIVQAHRLMESGTARGKIVVLGA